MLSSFDSGWLVIGSGAVILALVPFGLARLSKEPTKRKHQQRFFSLIGLVWLGLSMVLDGLAKFFSSHAVILNDVGLLLALIAVGFFLRGLFVKGMPNSKVK